ncbi:DegV family protein [Clostridium sp. JNZ J1-5]
MLHIVTDSSCDLPKNILEENNIKVVPLTISIDGKDYKEGIDISAEEFHKKMLTSKELPKTSQPSPINFAKAFEEFSEEDSILCMTISSGLSGTYQSASLGRDMCKNKDNIFIFDTLAGSLGHGIQILKANKMSLEGKPVSTIIEELEKIKNETTIFILLDTLDNIVKGGRLSKFKGTLASILDIKTILEGINGKVELIEKVRGKKKFINRTIESIGNKCSDFSDRVFGITHVSDLDDALLLKKLIIENFNPKDVIINTMGCTMSTYAGKNGMIISF